MAKAMLQQAAFQVSRVSSWGSSTHRFYECVSILLAGNCLHPVGSSASGIFFVHILQYVRLRFYPFC